MPPIHCVIQQQQQQQKSKVLLTFSRHIASTPAAADITVDDMQQTEIQWLMFIICSYRKTMRCFSLLHDHGMF